MSATTVAYKAKRKRNEKLGLIGIWGGALMLLVDMSTSFPTPARGALAMWWLLVVGAGCASWVLSRKLPIEESIRLADEHDGELTVPNMTMELGLPVSMADKTLQSLCDCGQAMAIHTGHRSTWFFFNTNAADSRLVRALDMIEKHETVPTATEFVDDSIARDLDEAEEMLKELAEKGYITDQEVPDSDASESA
jgi:hypothetical protein